jgi:hypothetical protein
MIELRAFMGLGDLFRERSWPSPLEVDIRGGMTGPQLLAMLDIPPAKVEVIFVAQAASSWDYTRYGG